VAGIEQDIHRDRMIHADIYGAHVAHFFVVGDGRDRAFIRVLDLDANPRAIGQQRTVPAARPEWADRRERHQRCVDGNDRPLGGQIVGSGPGRRGQQHPIGDQLGQPLAAVDQDAQLGGLVGFPEHRDFIEGVEFMHAAAVVACAHQERVDDAGVGGGEPLTQAIHAKFVHQESDGAAVHSVITSALSDLTAPYCLRSRFSASLASPAALATNAMRS
jgi:hypothetical protein